MSLNNPGNKQTIVLHNCEINDKKYDLVITLHKQTIGYIRTKRQTKKEKFSVNKDKLHEKDFQSEETQSTNQKPVTCHALYKLKDSVNKNYPVKDQLFFSDSETYHIHQYKENEE